jgi:uncharacterized membrane protein YphA (DoxX/SURF4 family)
MKLNRPIGNELYAPLLIRGALGSYILLAGLVKLENLAAFVEEVKKLGMLPEHLATVYAILLPYFEIFAGGLLVMGLWTILGAIIASFHFASLVYVFGFFTGSGILFNKDVVLLAAALSILYSGAGAFSLDRFRQTG